MKKLLPVAHPLSMLCALMLAVTALVLCAAKVFPLLAQAESGSAFVLGLVAYCTVVELFGCVVYLLVMSTLVLTARGRAFVGFAPVAKCRSIRAWLCSSWHFFGAGGQQEGLRILGFEIALQGQL